MCCNNNRSCWNQAQTGSSCYVAMPQFLSASNSSDDTTSGLSGRRFVVTGTLDQFYLLGGCSCGCNSCNGCCR